MRHSLGHCLLTLSLLGFITLASNTHAERHDDNRQFSNQQLGQLDQATKLNSTAFKLFSKRDIAGAERAAKQSLAIRQAILGEEHEHTAVSAGTLGYIYSKTGKLQQALPLLTLSNRVSEQKLGLNHSYTGISINNLARLYGEMARYKEAVPLYERALTIYRNIHGEMHEETAAVYRNFAGIYEKLGQHKKALAMFKKALAIRTQVLGKYHKKTSISHQNIAHAYHYLGDNTNAIKHFEQTIAIDKRNDGADSATIAYGYNDLANVYSSMGEYKKALELAKKALALREKHLGNTSFQTALSYNTTALIHKKLAQYDDAIRLMKKTLAIVEAKKGTQHDSTASVYSNLAGLYKTKADYETALAFYNKGYEIRRNKFGDNHPKVAESHTSIAAMYSKLGQFDKAKHLYEKAIVIEENIFGVEHAKTATSYSLYGGFYKRANDYVNAKKWYTKALTIRKKILGENNIKVAITYNNLAQIYADENNTSKGLPLAKKATAIIEKKLGDKHDYTAISYTTLAAFYNDLEQHEETLALYLKAQKIIENKFGTEHISAAGMYVNLANVYYKLKQYKKAKQYYEKAIPIYNKTMGSASVQSARIQNNYSKLLLTRFSELLPAYHQSLTSFAGYRETRDSIFTTFEKDIKKHYLDKNKNIVPWLIYSGHKLLTEQQKTGTKQPTSAQKNIDPTLVAYSDEQIKSNSFTAWLNTKGALYDSENMLAMMTNSTNDKDVLAWSQELKQRKLHLSKLHQRIEKQPLKSEKIHHEITTVTKEIAALESRLATKAQRFSAELGLKNISVNDIASSLSPKQLYIDFAYAYGNLFAFSVNHDKQVAFYLIANKAELKNINQGIQTIQTDIATYQREISSGNADRNTKTTFKRQQQHQFQALYKRLFSDFPELLSKPELVISPDGALRLLPFEALIDDQGRYLIETKTISYVPSGKEWLRLKRQKPTKTKTDLTLLYNPSYQANVSDTRGFVNRDSTPNTDISKQIKLIDMAFSNLAGTKVEGEGILNLAKQYQQKNIKDYEKAAANKDNLLSTHSSKFLHIASHGFFINDDTLQNPMLKSGLALAGAKKGSFTGKVTALELTGMKLSGTDTVVLSACETGKVNVNDTEAVSGLTKAFIQAGAKNVVMSLWSVPDQATATLMQSYYKNMYQLADGKASGNHKAHALRQAKLRLIKQKKLPIDWAAFVMNGS